MERYQFGRSVFNWGALRATFPWRRNRPRRWDSVSREMVTSRQFQVSKAGTTPSVGKMPEPRPIGQSPYEFFVK